MAKKYLAYVCLELLVVLELFLLSFLFWFQLRNNHRIAKVTSPDSLEYDISSSVQWNRQDNTELSTYNVSMYHALNCLVSSQHSQP